MTPGRLEVDRLTGKVTGPARIEYNDPFPTANGTPGGSGAMMGLVLHTENGYEQGTIATFNDPASQASAFFAVGLDVVTISPGVRAATIHQFGPIGKDWMAWAQVDGNPHWYSVEDADNHPGKPPITEPFSPEQIVALAQLLELLSRFAGFPLQLSDSPDVKGLGWHGMGGAAWGDHPYCPGDVRKAQRPAILALAKDIRAGTAPPKPDPDPKPADLDGYVVYKDVLGGFSGRAVISADSGKSWQ